MRCRYCKRNIIEVTFTMGPKWMHQTPGASYMDGTYEWCHIMVATPDPDGEADAELEQRRKE